MKQKILYAGLLLAIVSIFNFSCKKENEPETKKIAATENYNREEPNGHLSQTKNYSSDVVIQWLNMDLNMLRVPLAPGTGSQAADRVLAYNGLACYEAVVPGMPAYQPLNGQLSSYPTMPATEPGKAYHWAASANAALAYMNRHLFPTTSVANQNAMNALENTLQAQYATETDDATLQRSINFGREVATRLFAWAATDGSANVNPPYVPPVGLGLWVPTAPTPAVNPYLFQRRLLVPGVAAGTDIPAPPTYSPDPASPFFAMVKDVYDKSLVLTPDQTAMAIYHRDAPGYPGGGHFVAVLSQVLDKAKPTLDIAALAFAKAGIAFNDAVIICFTKKYTVNLVRPVTYIRNEMQLPGWNTLIPTPNHPEYPSAHAVNSAAVAWMLTNVLGDNFQFTLHTYDYLNLPPRSYNSFIDMSKEMADSRVFGGIHYQASCDIGRWQGQKVAENILSKVKFLKE